MPEPANSPLTGRQFGDYQIVGRPDEGIRRGVKN
jgi:hypothetical protein